MATIHQKFTGDAGQLEKEIEKLRAQQIKLEEQLAKTSKKGVEGNKELQAQVRAGIALSKELGKETETIGDRHRRMKTELKAAWLTGQISQKQYSDGLLQLDKRLQVSLDQIKKNRDAVNDKSGSVQKLNQQVIGMASSWMSVSKAIQIATEALREHKAEREKGRAETERLADVRKELLQVSKGDFSKLEETADAAAVKFGVDRSTARRVLFTARSEGFEGDYENVMKLDPIMAPESAARIAGQVRKLFDKENLSAMGSINAVVQGANYSRLSVEELTSALPQAGEGGRQQGATLDETVAGLAVLSSVFKSGETTGDRLKMLMSKMAIDKRTSGKGLLGGLDIIQGMSDKDREKFLGDSQELRAAYTAATDKEDEIRQQTGAVRDARLKSSATDTLLKEYYSNDTLFWARQANRSGALRQEIAEETFSARESRNQAYRDFTNAQMTERGTSAFGRFMVNRVQGTADLLGADVASSTGGQQNNSDFRKWMDGQREATQQQTDSLKSIEANTRKAAQVPAGANRNAGEERD